MTGCRRSGVIGFTTTASKMVSLSAARGQCGEVLEAGQRNGAPDRLLGHAQPDVAVMDYSGVAADQVYRLLTRGLFD